MECPPPACKNPVNISGECCQSCLRKLTLYYVQNSAYLSLFSVSVAQFACFVLIELNCTEKVTILITITLGFAYNVYQKCEVDDLFLNLLTFGLL